MYAAERAPGRTCRTSHPREPRSLSLPTAERGPPRAAAAASAAGEPGGAAALGLGGLLGTLGVAVVSYAGDAGKPPAAGNPPDAGKPPEGGKPPVAPGAGGMGKPAKGLAPPPPAWTMMIKL